MEKKPKIDNQDLDVTNSGEIEIKKLAKKLAQLNQRSGLKREGPSVFDKIPRFRGDYANAYAANLMFLGMGKDLEYVKKYFPILKFNEYSEMKIRQEIAAGGNIKSEETQGEVENRLAEEAKEITKADLTDIEEVDRLVDEVNNEYQEALSAGLSLEEKDKIKNSIIEKLKQIDKVVKRRQ